MTGPCPLPEVISDEAIADLIESRYFGQLHRYDRQQRNQPNACPREHCPGQRCPWNTRCPLEHCPREQLQLDLFDGADVVF